MALKEGDRTPWGRADQVEDIAPGVQAVGTSTHGGIKLDRKRNALIPAPFRRGGGWYEEDAEDNIVLAFLPDGFTNLDVTASVQYLRDQYPDAWITHYGDAEPLSPARSRVLRERAWWEGHADDYVVRAAWGAWYPTVPVGSVGVCAYPGRECQKNCPDHALERWFLVPEIEYDARDQLGFVIDLERHQPWNRGEP